MLANYRLALPSSPQIGPEQHVPIPGLREELFIIVYVSSEREHPRKLPLAGKFFFILHQDVYFIQREHLALILGKGTTGRSQLLDGEALPWLP